MKLKLRCQAGCEDGKTQANKIGNHVRLPQRPIHGENVKLTMQPMRDTQNRQRKAMLKSDTCLIYVNLARCKTVHNNDF